MELSHQNESERGCKQFFSKWKNSTMLRKKLTKMKKKKLPESLMKLAYLISTSSSVWMSRNAGSMFLSFWFCLSSIILSMHFQRLSKSRFICTLSMYKSMKLTFALTLYHLIQCFSTSGLWAQAGHERQLGSCKSLKMLLQSKAKKISLPVFPHTLPIEGQVFSGNLSMCTNKLCRLHIVIIGTFITFLLY